MNSHAKAFLTMMAGWMSRRQQRVVEEGRLRECRYDLDGNLESDGQRSYAWDGENRLIKVNLLSNHPEERDEVTYAYDYEGRRVRKTRTHHVLGAEGWESTQLADHYYVYDGWNLLEIFSPAGGTDGLTWGLDLSGTLQGAGGVGGLLSVFESTIKVGGNNQKLYYTYDANGNVSEVLNNAGSVVAHYEYSPFGETTYQSGYYADQNPYRFSTKYLDTETDLYYYGYRYYDPETGRWLSRDPIEEQGGLNLYAFVGNDGVNAWDYLGLIDPLWKQFPLKVAVYGFNPLQSSDAVDGEGQIDIGADYTFTSQQRGGIKRLVLDYFDINNDNKLTAKDCPPFDLRVTGYSWGAWTALEVAHDLSRSSKLENPMDLEIRMGLVDPVNTLRSGFSGGRQVGPPGRQPRRWVGRIRVGSRPSNVVYGLNIYQQNGLNNFFGYDPGPAGLLFVGSKINGFTNLNVTDRQVTPGRYIDHVRIVLDYGDDIARITFKD